jgi:hypothetical protein
MSVGLRICPEHAEERQAGRSHRPSHCSEVDRCVPESDLLLIIASAPTARPNAGLKGGSLFGFAERVSGEVVRSIITSTPNEVCAPIPGSEVVGNHAGASSREFRCTKTQHRAHSFDHFCSVVALSASIAVLP